jgi:hypothetical protein
MLRRLVVHAVRWTESNASTRSQDAEDDLAARTRSLFLFLRISQLKIRLRQTTPRNGQKFSGQPRIATHRLDLDQQEVRRRASRIRSRLDRILTTPVLAQRSLRACKWTSFWPNTISTSTSPIPVCFPAGNPAAAEILLPVLLYIGSLFTHSVRSAPLEDAAKQAIDLVRTRPGPPSPYYIQALALYCIAVYWCNESERGRTLLDEAIRGALDLGMHTAEFASENSQGDSVLAESWRRTWWSIYITDAHISGSTHTYPTQTGRIQTSTELPCEEHLYESGVSSYHPYITRLPLTWCI